MPANTSYRNEWNKSIYKYLLFVFKRILYITKIDFRLQDLPVQYNCRLSVYKLASRTTIHHKYPVHDNILAFFH